MEADAARMSIKKRGNGLALLKAFLLAALPALVITAPPYLTYLMKLPFTRNEMRVLCWFPGEVIVGEIWQLLGKSTGEDIVGAYAFFVASQVCNVFLYTIFFYICF